MTKETNMDQTKLLKQATLSSINISLSFGYEMISMSKSQLNHSDLFESAKNMTTSDLDYGIYTNNTDHGGTNQTLSQSKNKILIWIGSYAINSERVAIFILFAGLLFLFALILQSWRKDVINKRKYKEYRSAQQDLPPTYSELVSRKNPPEYKESLMQVYNGISNERGFTLRINTKLVIKKDQF